MKLVTTVEIQLSPKETEAWITLFEAVCSAAHATCEDSDVTEAINDFYMAMVDFGEYFAR